MPKPSYYEITILFSDIFKYDYRDYKKKFRSGQEMINAILKTIEAQCKQAPERNALDTDEAYAKKERIFNLETKANEIFRKEIEKLPLANISPENYYSMLKASSIKAVNEAEMSEIQSHNFSEGKYRGLRLDLLQDCLNLLSSGDKTMRGSSDAYKEIQQDLRNLLTANTPSGIIHYGSSPSENRYNETMLHAIVEKAGNYIKNHSGVEVLYSADSYKGKRVALMRKVCNILTVNAHMMDIERYAPYEKNSVDDYEDFDETENIITGADMSDINDDMTDFSKKKKVSTAANPQKNQDNTINQRIISYIDQEIYTEKYKQNIQSAFESCTFNKELYAECRLCDRDLRPENMDYSVIKNHRKLAKQSKIMQMLSKGLNGQKVSLEQANEYYTKIEKCMKTFENNKSNPTFLAKAATQHEKNLKANPLAADRLDFLKDMVYVHKSNFKPITGNKQLDFVIDRTMMKFYKTAAAELNTKKEVLKVQDPNATTHSPENEQFRPAADNNPVL